MRRFASFVLFLCFFFSFAYAEQSVTFDTLEEFQYAIPSYLTFDSEQQENGVTMKLYSGWGDVFSVVASYSYVSEQALKSATVESMRKEALSFLDGDVTGNWAKEQNGVIMSGAFAEDEGMHTAVIAANGKDKVFTLVLIAFQPISADLVEELSTHIAIKQNSSSPSTDAVCFLIKSALSDAFSSKNVSYQNGKYIVTVSLDGVADEVTIAINIGLGKNYSLWEKSKETMLSLSDSIIGLLEALEIENPQLTFYLLNDKQPTNFLLRIDNGVIVYDVMENPITE